MTNEDARNDSLTGLIMELADSIMRRCECMLPCVVTKVSGDRKRVAVRPLVRIVGQDGSTLPRDTIEGLTVYQAGAGDLVMSFPVSVGDIGWIEAADRDLGLFLQSYTESDPPTRRKHSFSDARFVPDIMTNFTIAAEDAGAVVIQNRAGTVKIALDDGQIRIVNGATRIEVGNGTVVGTAPGGFILNGATITSSGDFITPLGNSVDNHFHTQGNDSDGDSEQDTSASVPTEV